MERQVRIMSILLLQNEIRRIKFGVVLSKKLETFSKEIFFWHFTSYLEQVSCFIGKSVSIELFYFLIAATAYVNGILRKSSLMLIRLILSFIQCYRSKYRNIHIFMQTLKSDRKLKYEICKWILAFTGGWYRVKAWSINGPLLGRQKKTSFSACLQQQQQSARNPTSRLSAKWVIDERVQHC